MKARQLVILSRSFVFERATKNLFLSSTERRCVPRPGALSSTMAGVLGLALLLLWGAVAGAQSLPPLPELPLQTYEPSIRGPISEAHEAALARPDDPARNGILGMVLYAHEQFEFAVPCLERAHALDPGEGRWAYYLGRAELHLAHYDRAAAFLVEALRLRSDYLPAQVRLAESLLEAGRWTRACLCTRGSWRCTPTSPRCTMAWAESTPAAVRWIPRWSTWAGRASCFPRSGPPISPSPGRTGTGGEREGPGAAGPLPGGQAGLAQRARPPPRRHRGTPQQRDGPSPEGDQAGRRGSSAGGGRRPRSGPGRRSGPAPGSDQPDPALRRPRPAGPGRGAVPGRTGHRLEPRGDPLQLRCPARETAEEPGGRRGLSPGHRAEADLRRGPEQLRVPPDDLRQAGRGRRALPGRSRDEARLPGRPLQPRADPHPARRDGGRHRAPAAGAHPGQRGDAALHVRPGRRLREGREPPRGPEVHAGRAGAGRGPWSVRPC